MKSVRSTIHNTWLGDKNRVFKLWGEKIIQIKQSERTFNLIRIEIWSSIYDSYTKH